MEVEIGEDMLLGHRIDGALDWTQAIVNHAVSSLYRMHSNHVLLQRSAAVVPGSISSKQLALSKIKVDQTTNDHYM